MCLDKFLLDFHTRKQNIIKNFYQNTNNYKIYTNNNNNIYTWYVYIYITFESIILAILKTWGTNSTGFCSFWDNSGRPTKAHLYLDY